MSVNNFTVGDKCIQIIQHFEGCYHEAYLDETGIPTIGFGHTQDVCLGQTATDDEIIKYLKEDMADTEHWVNLLVTVPLNQDQFDALASFTFNVGCGNLERSTLLKLLNRGHYDQVPKQLLEWNEAGGVPLAGLTYRRKAEGLLFSTGQVEFEN
jgi:lysozyme